MGRNPFFASPCRPTRSSFWVENIIIIYFINFGLREGAVQLGFQKLRRFSRKRNVEKNLRPIIVASELKRERISLLYPRKPDQEFFHLGNEIFLRFIWIFVLFYQFRNRNQKKL